MITGKSVVGGENYEKNHLKANDYYEKESQVKGYWIGDACELYGVKAGEEVTAEAFEVLRTNCHAITGAQITRRQNTTRQESNGEIVANRRSFHDFVFSAPKSFSVLGVTCGNEKVREWHDVAVRAAVKEMEKWTARRDHKNPESFVEITGKFAAAWYKHDANRSLEPNLHDHVVIFNMTPSKDGHSYAIESRTFYDRTKYLTAIYRDTLAKQAIDAGCHVEYDQFGAPQIRSKESSLKGICDHFSSRAGMKAYLTEKCEKLLGSTLSNNEVTLLVRSSRGFRKDSFEEKFAEKSFSGSRYEILRDFCTLVKKSSDGGFVETTTDAVLDAQRKSLDKEDWKLLENAQVAIDGIIKKENTPLPSLVDSFKASVKHCFERKSVVFDYELFEKTLKHCCGKGISPDTLRDLLNQFAGSGKNQLVKIGSEVTTADHLLREKDLIKWVSKGKGFLKDSVKDFNPASGLSAEQSAAVLKILRSSDQFKVLVGKAGTGKTFTLSEIVRGYVESGKKVFMFAPSNGARDVLRSDGEKMESATVAEPFLKAESLQMLLVNKDRQEIIGKGSVVILDEAGLTSVKQMHEFCKTAFYKEWNVVLCGDPRQHTSVEAGDALRVLLRNTPVERARLNTIVRQTNKEYLAAAKDFASGNTTEGFKKLDKMGAIVEMKGEDFVGTLAKKYLELKDPNDKNAVLIVVPTNREIDSVSGSIRESLKEKGELQNEKAIETIRSLGWTVAEKEDARNYREGMVVQFNKGSLKGETWEVIQVDPEKGVICKDAEGKNQELFRKGIKDVSVCEKRVLELAPGDLIMNRLGCKDSGKEVVNGEILRFKGVSPQGHIETFEGKTINHQNVSYGYASTSHKAQGATYKNVVIGFDRHSIGTADQKVAYVASTRGKTNIHLVVENKEDLRGIQNRTGNRQSALELAQKKLSQRSELKAAANTKTLEALKNNQGKSQREDHYPAQVNQKSVGVKISLR